MSLSCILLLCLAVASAFAMSPHLWTKLILTHHWPNTFCSMNPCHHPNVEHWTLHGFWPDVGNMCNNTWNFNSTEIEDLLPDMQKSWPDLLKASSAFWKHEWSKHGTCAAKSLALNSQHKYFSKALELYHKLDLDSILKKFDIIPSEEFYKFSQIEQAIEGFYGVKPKIQCVHSFKNDDNQTLGQIEICFNATFSLLDCEHDISFTGTPGFSVCDHNIPIYYPPL
ncbi:ribonuclease T2 isoform X2 [Stigmatopora nigra]